MKQDQLLVEVKDIKTYFFLNEGLVRALDGVDFNIWRGQTLGVVGESGCGKSVTARSILRIVEPVGSNSVSLTSSMVVLPSASVKLR